MKIEGKVSNYTLPFSWKEISKKDWFRISSLLSKGKVYDPEILSLLLKKKGKKIKRSTFHMIPDEAFYYLFDCLDWLQDSYCTTAPFEAVKIGFKKFWLPAERMTNISVIEYAYIDLCMVMVDFLEKKEKYEEIDEWIDRLCAYICRPIDPKINVKDSGYTGDRRELFNPILIDNRLPLFKKLHPSYKLGCLWFVIGCKRYIHNHYKASIFPPTHTPEGKPIIGRETSSKPEPLRWMKVIRQLSGGKFGDLENTRRANIYDVLDELRDQHKTKR